MQTGILHTTDALLSLDIDADDPLGIRELSHAALKVFSSERSADIYAQLRHRLESRTGLSRGVLRESYIPYPVSSDIAVTSSGSSAIAFCGTTRSEHRGHRLCEALSGLQLENTLVWCIEPSEKEAANRILQKSGIKSYELIEDRSVDTWLSVLNRASVAVHTVFSAYTDPGPWLAASLMAGVPALVTNFGYGEYLPDGVVLKIDPGEGERQAIANAIGSVLGGNSGAKAGELKSGARLFAEEHHSADVVADEIRCLVDKHADYLSAIRQKWERYVIHKSSVHPSQSFDAFGKRLKGQRISSGE
jgi:hypothetical protein